MEYSEKIVSNFGLIENFKVGLNDIQEHTLLWNKLDLESPNFPLQAEYAVKRWQGSRPVYRYGVCVGDKVPENTVYNMIKHGHTDMNMRDFVRALDYQQQFAVPALDKHKQDGAKVSICAIDKERGIVVARKGLFLSAHSEVLREMKADTLYTSAIESAY